MTPIFKKSKEGWTLWLARDGQYYSGSPPWDDPKYRPAFDLRQMIGKTFRVNSTGAWAHGLKVTITGLGKRVNDLRGIVEGENFESDVAFSNLAPLGWKLKPRSIRNPFLETAGLGLATGLGFGLGVFGMKKILNSRNKKAR